MNKPQSCLLKGTYQNLHNITLSQNTFGDIKKNTHGRLIIIYDTGINNLVFVIPELILY